MGKQKRLKSNKQKPQSIKNERFTWKIVSIFAIIISASLIVSLVFSQNSTRQKSMGESSVSQQTPASFDARVQLVASRFKCACGGCGELPLIDCTCDMPRGAVEEKTFIRDQLQNGLTIDQVVRLVNEKYGLLIS